MQDKSTLSQILKDLDKRFGLRRVIIVADRGITSIGNIEEILKFGYGYILGVSLRKSKLKEEILKRLKDLG